MATTTPVPDPGTKNRENLGLFRGEAVDEKGRRNSYISQALNGEGILSRRKKKKALTDTQKGERKPSYLLPREKCGKKGSSESRGEKEETTL